jgi:phosphoribosylaminoimidazolecarboxamide formyltransferase / IMP cyclohydrolase
MLRSAAKNFTSVWVLVDPADYAGVLTHVLAAGTDDQPLRRRLLAEKVYAHTSATMPRSRSGSRAARRAVPRDVSAGLRPSSSRCATARTRSSARRSTWKARRGLGALVQKGGKELSFNNLLDLEGALLAIEPFGERAVLRDHQAHHALRSRRGQRCARRLQEGAGVRPGRRSDR